MELLDRYLEAVKKHLPWERQDDIIAELRANLESQLEEKEAALGRPLTAKEAEDWLKGLGQPIQVAAAYQPQRYLIGPGVFPMYWYVLKTAMTWATVIYSIVVAAELLATPNPSAVALLKAVLRVPGVLIVVAAWVTGIFAIFEYIAAHYGTNCLSFAAPAGSWSPSWSSGGLPPLAQQGIGTIKPKRFAQAVAELIFTTLGLIWLLLLPSHPYLMLGPGAQYLQASPFQLAPVWMQFYWCIVALNILQLGWRAEVLLRRRWQQPRPVQHLVIGAMGLVPLGVLLSVRDHAMITLKYPAVDGLRYGATLNTINVWAYRGLLITLAIVTLQLLWEVGQSSLEAYKKRVIAR